MGNKKDKNYIVNRAANAGSMPCRGRKIMSKRPRVPVLNGASGWMTGTSEDPEEKYKIRTLKYQYHNHTLRSLGGKFNVSHNTVRKALAEKLTTPIAVVIRAYVDGLEFPYFGGQGAH